MANHSAGIDDWTDSLVGGETNPAVADAARRQLRRMCEEAERKQWRVEEQIALAQDKVAGCEELEKEQWPIDARMRQDLASIAHDVRDIKKESLGPADLRRLCQEVTTKLGACEESGKGLLKSELASSDEKMQVFLEKKLGEILKQSVDRTVSGVKDVLDDQLSSSSIHQGPGRNHNKEHIFNTSIAS